MLLELASEPGFAPALLGPCSFCDLPGATVMSCLSQLPSRRPSGASTCSAMPPVPPTLRFSFGPTASGHDAACSTACLVHKGGLKSLDAALAMLQMLLDSGEAYRIQGYLAFLPEHCERGDEFPPPVERLWALPMVVVEGFFRGRLEISPVTRAAADSAVAPAQPVQESAFDAAATDRGGCKVFLCGRNLEEPQLRAQLRRIAAPGFGGPVCNLEEWPEAAQALNLRDQKVKAALAIEPFDASVGQGREAAEAFAAKLAGALNLDLPAPLAPLARRSMLGRLRRGSVTEAVEVHWVDGKVTVSAPSLETQATGALRFVPNPGYEVLVLGSEVYCRQRASPEQHTAASR
ncbi:unnamed protein product [Effrenium voratum]|nr:unnamed protein product [Effrenium voratum]